MTGDPPLPPRAPDPSGSGSRHSLSWIGSVVFAVLAGAYLAASLGLYFLLGPFRTTVGGVGVSLTSLTNPIKIFLLLSLIASAFRYWHRVRTDHSLGLDRFLTNPFDPSREAAGGVWPRLTPTMGLVLVCALVYLVGFKVRQHLTYDTGAYDLALYDHALYNTLRGDFMKAYGLDHNFFGQHFAPILLLLVPLYALWPSPLLLLTVQGVAAALTLGAVWLLAGQLGIPGWWALLTGLVFTLHPAYWKGFRFDFHPEMLLPLFVCLAVSFLGAGRPRLAYAMVLLALAVKEDVALYAVLWGALVAATSARGWGALVVATAMAWLILAAVVIPLSAPPGMQSLIVDRYGQYGTTWWDLTRNLALDSPRLLWRAGATASSLLLEPLLWVPVFSVGYLAVGLVAVMANVASRYPYQAQLGVYYGVPALTFFMLGYVAVLGRLFRGGPRLKALAAGLVLLSFGLVDVPPWRQSLPADRFLAAQLAALAAEGRPISTNSVLVPHLPHNRAVYIFPVVHDAEVVAIYLRPGDDGVWLVEPRRFFQDLFALLEAGTFGVQAFDGHTLILERGRSGPAPADVTASLAARYRHLLRP